MINERDVIKVFMPFPNDKSGLALLKHYYICNQNNSNKKILFKCQTQKANMITQCGVEKFRKKFYQIRPSNSVPFKQNTVVDKEWSFELLDTIVPLEYLSPEKPSNIPDTIYNNIVTELRESSLKKINKEQFIELNPNCI